MKLLTKEQQESYENVSYENVEIWVFCKEKFENIWKIKNIVRVRDHYHQTGQQRNAVDSICNLIYSVPNKIPIIFKKDDQFIIKELAENSKNNSLVIEKSIVKKSISKVPFHTLLLFHDYWITFYNFILWKPNFTHLSTLVIQTKKAGKI